MYCIIQSTKILIESKYLFYLLQVDDCDTYIKTKREQNERFVPPSKKYNNERLSRNSIVTNSTYREYLTDNSEKIIQKNKELYKTA